MTPLVVVLCPWSSTRAGAVPAIPAEIVRIRVKPKSLLSFDVVVPIDTFPLPALTKNVGDVFVPARRSPHTSSLERGDDVVPIPTLPPSVAKRVEPVTVSADEDALPNVVCPTTLNTPVKIPLLPVNPVAERLVVEALRTVKLVVDAVIAAKRVVVELVLVLLTEVRPMKSPFVAPKVVV
jgi:hypothetical protein